MGSLTDLQRLIATMDSKGLDVLVYPTWSNPPELVGQWSPYDGESCLSDTSTSIGCSRSMAQQGHLFTLSCLSSMKGQPAHFSPCSCPQLLISAAHLSIFGAVTCAHMDSACHSSSPAAICQLLATACATFASASATRSRVVCRQQLTPDSAADGQPSHSGAHGLHA